MFHPPRACREAASTDISAAPRRPRSLTIVYLFGGLFEIIELTHLSDGERRNAKRSPGEVPAAPTPNLSCLQIAQSLHHNRWDSCLSFLPRSHMFTDGDAHAGSGRTHSTRLVRTRWCSRTRHLSWMRGPNGQGCVRHTSADTQIHTFSQFFCHFLHLLSVCSFFPSLISMYKVNISSLQGTTLPQTWSVTKEQMQGH